MSHARRPGVVQKRYSTVLYCKSSRTNHHVLPVAAKEKKNGRAPCSGSGRRKSRGRARGWTGARSVSPFIKRRLRTRARRQARARCRRGPGRGNLSSVKELSQVAPNQRGDRPAQGRGPPEETRIQALRGPCPEWASTGLAVRPSSWPDSADSAELREAARDPFFVPPSRPAWSP